MNRETYILFGMGGWEVNAKQTDIATTLLARDYKGMNNFGANGVIEMKVNRIGGLYDGDMRHQSGSVYDKDGLSPSIDTMQGGNREPMVLEDAKVIGGLGEKKSNGGTQYFQQDRIYYGDVAMCHPSQIPGGSYNYLVEDKTICAMRGRSVDNPSDRRRGIELEQRLEPNGEGICNTLASVTKDNMLLETVKVREATKKGYAECNIGGVADLLYPTSNTRRGRVQENGEVSPTLTAENNGVCRIESRYRIRKLTPRECFRLMDFSDEDFDKASSVCLNTQLYKQAGNSIVKNCLVAIFGQMIPGKENVYKERMQ